MFIGLLVASALGMAVASSTRRPSSRQALHGELFGPSQLQLPLSHSAPQMTTQASPRTPTVLPDGIPSLLETFRYSRTIYVVFIADGYFMGALLDEDEAIQVAEEMPEDDPEIQHVTVEKVEVPWELSDTLLEEGRSAFGGGYEAANKVASQGKQPTTIFEWTIFDEDFDDWPDELKEAHRDRISHQLDTKTLEPSQLLYSSTDLPERIEEDDIENLEHLWVSTDRAATMKTTTLSSFRPRPDDRRLLTYRVLSPIEVHVVPEDEVDYVEQVLDIDFGDEEDIDSKLSDLPGVSIDHIEARGRILLRNLTSDDIELVNVEPA